MPAEHYVKQGDTAPNLHPFPAVSRDVPLEYTPREVWREWYALPKSPLIVFARGAGLTGTYELDALLGAAVLRWVPAPWHLENESGQSIARVLPLPLALLGIVPGPERRNPTRLPVWASTSLAPAGAAGLAALCIGHADTVRKLLHKLPDIDGQPVSWSVADAPIGEAEALATIQQGRPMPDTAERFTPPYWHDWMAQHG